ncbi:MAG TPA: adenylate/guanylate cyclase domain-containing protein [Candidatus Competibacteraceae bacterium]|nr:adenylate/guanylate cyclase domain-containing protein [Candidatus Competibacteraceae bacterium]
MALRWLRMALLTLASALALLGLALVPPLLGLEGDVGPEWLFRLRGPRPAPDEVVVVTIDRESSRRLALPNIPRQWPRALHARLVRKLAAEGAAVIAFDVLFHEPREAEQDEDFAAALREAGNVVLFEYLERDRETRQGATPLAVEIERRQPPIPLLAEASAALAPFPLPKTSQPVRQFWLFKNGAGDTPTLPVAALHVYARPLYGALLQLLAAEALDPALPTLEQLRHHAGLMELARRLRHHLHRDPDLAARLLARAQSLSLDPAQQRLLHALIRLHAAHEDSQYLDFYGPPRSIRTIPYHLALEQPLELRGKAVFVGFSENFQPQQKDGFVTVYSQADGVDLSGVEIAATAFANLLEERAVRPLGGEAYALLLLVWAVLAVLLLVLLPAAWLLTGGALLLLGYLGGAVWLFGRDGLWLPLLGPLLLQVLLLLALYGRYLYSRAAHRRLQQAAALYLPRQAMAALARGPQHVQRPGEQVFGVCLASDAERYTALAESLAPAELHALLNRYYHALFEPVRRHGGWISDVVGDAMLAVWSAALPPAELRRQACLAALEVLAAVERFNQGQGLRLPTRLGLHCGPLLLGSLGGQDHYEYRAVGDVVNAATRVQELNKRLGTRLLVSGAVLEGLEGFVSRPLGRFRLPGKRQILQLCELCGQGQADPATWQRHVQFARGLEAFQRGEWALALQLFQQLLDRHGEDGPARYYLQLCGGYLQQPPAHWDGVVTLSKTG